MAPVCAVRGVLVGNADHRHLFCQPLHALLSVVRFMHSFVIKQ